MPAKRGTEITYGCTKILNGYTFTGNRIYGNFKPLEIYGEPYARERQAVGNLRATVRKKLDIEKSEGRSLVLNSL